MDGLRDWLKKNPAVGWTVALIACAVAVYFAVFARSSGGQYMPDQMTEMVTIKFSDDGETMELPRGRLIRELMRSGHSLDPSKGVTNPKTGQPTGFPYNKNDWEQMLKQIAQDRAESAARHGGQLIPPQPAARPPLAPGNPVEPPPIPTKGG